MHYLSWAGVQIPLCFVQGLSYAKRAKTIERRGGYVTPRGFETAEISAQILVTRANCMAFGLDFDAQIQNMQALTADKSNPSGGVSVGGFPIYPELQFALTNCNSTRTSDSVKGMSALSLDITLSGVSCSKEVTRTRSLEFDAVDAIPSVSIQCKGQKLLIQDGKQLSSLKTTPLTCSIECIIGDDTQTASRQGFVQSVLDEGGTVVVDLPTGSTVYNVIDAALVGNILVLNASILPEDAFKSCTITYQNKPLASVVRDLLSKCGIDGAKIDLIGQIDYFKTTSAPWDALKALSDSCGLVVNAIGNNIRAGWLPDQISAQESLEGSILEDDTNEHIDAILWRDGLHEFTAGSSKKGEIIEVKSCFCADDATFADKLLTYRKYKQTYLVLEGPIHEQAVHHSAVKVQKDGIEIPCIVDFYEIDWINGLARYECVHRGS